MSPEEFLSEKYHGNLHAVSITLDAGLRQRLAICLLPETNNIMGT